MLFVSHNSISIVAECENFVFIIEPLRLRRLVATQREVDRSNDRDFDKSTLSATRPSQCESNQLRKAFRHLAIVTFKCQQESIFTKLSRFASLHKTSRKLPNNHPGTGQTETTDTFSNQSLQNKINSLQLTYFHSYMYISKAYNQKDKYMIW